MERKFNLVRLQDKGGYAVTGKVKTLIGIVVLLVITAYTAPTALSGLFNKTAFQCVAGNCSNQTGVPAWAVTLLGILGVIAFVFIILNASD